MIDSRSSSGNFISNSFQRATTICLTWNHSLNKLAKKPRNDLKHQLSVVFRIQTTNRKINTEQLLTSSRSIYPVCLRSYSLKGTAKKYNKIKRLKSNISWTKCYLHMTPKLLLKYSYNQFSLPLGHMDERHWVCEQIPQIQWHHFFFIKKIKNLPK